MLNYRERTFTKGDALETFKSKTGGLSPEDYIKEIKSKGIEKAVEILKTSREVFNLLDNKMYNPQQIIYSEHDDFLVEHGRGYGIAEKPEDYLTEFGRFIKENINKIPALEIVCQRPQELTRETLKSLRLELNNQDLLRSI